MVAKKDVAVTLVVALHVDTGLLKERVCGRWIHKASGRSYHVKYAPPKSMEIGSDGKPVKESMKDDITGNALMQRPEDTLENLKKRLSAYHSQTVPILEHYAPLCVVRKVDGGQDVGKVWSDMKACLVGDAG